MTLSIFLALCTGLTFLAVMFVVMKDKATSTLTLVAAEGVHAVLLAATVVLGALVLVCKNAKKSNGSVWAEVWSPQGTWEAWQGASSCGRECAGGAGVAWEVRVMMELSPLRQWRQLSGPLLWAEVGRSRWREGWGLELTSMGTSTITCLLDRRTSGKTDTGTSRLQEKGAGRRGPSFTSQQEMSQTPSKWEGAGKVPLSAEGVRGRGEHQFCPAKGGGWNGRVEAGSGWAPKPPAHSVRGELPE